LKKLGIKGTLGDLIEMSERALADGTRGTDVAVFLLTSVSWS
jgi:hypothetical protein